MERANLNDAPARDTVAANAEWMGHNFVGGPDFGRLYGLICPKREIAGDAWRWDAYVSDASGNHDHVGTFDTPEDAREAVEDLCDDLPVIGDAISATGKGGPGEASGESEAESNPAAAAGPSSDDILRTHAGERPVLDPSGISADINRGLVLIGKGAALTVDAARDLLAATRSAVDTLILPAAGWSWELGREWAMTIDGKRRAYLMTPDHSAASTVEHPEPPPLRVGFVEFNAETGRHSAFITIHGDADSGDGALEIAEVATFGDAQLNLAAYFRSLIAAGEFPPAPIVTSGDAAGAVIDLTMATDEPGNAG